MNNKTYRILIGGDLLPSGSNVPLFVEGNVEELFGEEILQLFSNSDFSIVNLEGPLTDSTNQQEKAGPVIKAPKACINGIQALGVKAVALANNHITDYGQQGYEDTINTLDHAKIRHIGSGTTHGGVNSHYILNLGVKNICIYNVSERFFNVPGKNTAGANLYDEYLVCNEIKELRKTCDYMIVMYHGGAEYFQYPTPVVRQRCHRMVDSGADFIVTQHTHCIGCEEHYKDSYILHGQGNFLFARQKMFPNLTKEGLLTEICFTDDDVCIVNHHLRISNDVIRYKSDWDLKGFKKRSTQLNDEEMILAKYRDLKVSEIMNKFLAAAQGSSLPNRFLRRFFPKYYLRQLSHNYTRKQLLLNLCVIGQDRRNEDMLGVLEYLLEHTAK